MEKKWWHEAVVYEIYCKSFCDSNGDGIGDLQGIISKLPDLHDLGINCVWLTPIFKSPQVDNGYDVADYQDIDPIYGTLDDFRELLDKAHSLGIRIILDMVFNHTSDEHKWFQESKKSKDNPYRNYYIWQPPKPDGSVPNNWGNYFREGIGSTWEFDEATGEYYFHQYSKKMPDLNWEYEPMRQELYSMMKWWMDMGVDGFRFDVYTRYKKTPGFPDTKKEPDPLDINGFVADRKMCTCVEGIHEYLHDMYENTFAGRDVFTVGEGSGIDAKNAAMFNSQDRHEIDCSYHFNIASRKKPPFTVSQFRKVQSEWAEVMKHDTWTTQYLCNHDQPRIISHYGDEKEYRKQSAKLFASLIHTTPGTPFIYQGEEIGMTNVDYTTIEEFNDRYTIGNYNSMISSGSTPAEAIAALSPKSRDNARSPYQWSSAENAGFTTGKPWLKPNSNYTYINLEDDRKSPDSIFAYYQALIRMRKTHPAIIDGDLKFLLEESDDIIMYLRRCARETMLVIGNNTGKTIPVEIPQELKENKWKRILTNYPDESSSLDGKRDWLPWECEIYTLSF